MNSKLTNVRLASGSTPSWCALALEAAEGEGNALGVVGARAAGRDQTTEIKDQTTKIRGQS